MIKLLISMVHVEHLVATVAFIFIQHDAVRQCE